ncbi:unnamed protein product [Closterium sp. NIES-54]
MISSSIVSSSPLHNAVLQSNISTSVSIDSPASSSACSSHFRSLSSEPFAPPSKVRRLEGHFSPLENPKETEGSTEEEGVEEKGLLLHQLRSSAPAFSRDRADSSHLLLDAEPCHARGSSPKPSLASLPSELVRVIVSLVDAPRDRGCCALVCRAWRQWERATRTQLHLRGSLSDLPSLGTFFGSVTDLDLADVHPDWPGSEEELRQVFRTSFPNLRRVRANVSPSGMEYVRQCWPKLESVVIGHWDGLDEGLEARHVSSLVSRCPKVDSIDLSWSRHCDFNELPKQLSDYKLGRIRVLNLLGGPAPLRDDALEVFGRGAFPVLEELSFAMADGGVTDMGIASVARGCPALRVLRIEDVALDLNDSDEGDADGVADGGVADGVADGDGIGDTEDAAVDGPWGAFGGSVAAAAAVASEAAAAAAAAAADAVEVEQVDMEGLDEYVPLPPAAAASASISAVALASTLGPSPLPQSSPSPTSTAFLAAAAAAAAAASAGVAGVAAAAAATPLAQFAALAPAPPPNPVSTACPTYPITAAALESLARHCPRLEELCLVPSFCVHGSGPAVEALAAGCKSLRVLRLTRFLGLGRGVLAGGDAGENVAQREGGQEEEEEEEQEEQEAVKQEEQSQQFQQQEMQQQHQAQQWDGQFGSASPCAPFVDEPLSFPLAADNGGNPDGSNLDGGNPDGSNLDGGNLHEWIMWDSAPSLLPPTLVGFSSGWEVDDSLLADLQQWQQLQEQQQQPGEEAEQQQLGCPCPLIAAGSNETTSTGSTTTSIAACPNALPCASGCTSTFTSTSTSTNTNTSISTTGSSRSPVSPPSPLAQPPILPPLAQFVALEELELQMCSDMTDRDVQAVLEGCPKLRRLEVVANHRLSARAFALGCALCASGVRQCAVAAAGGSCRARGRALESVRVMQCDNVDSHALLHALMPARTTLKGIQMTASWTHTSPPLPLACFSALESLCLEVSVDASLSPLLSAGLASCPNLKFFFLSLYGALEQDTLPLPPHHYSLAFLSQPPTLTYLFLSLEGVQCATAPALASLELALLASCPSLAIQEIEFRPAPCPVVSAPLCLDLLSPDAARLLSLSPCLRRVTLGGVVQEPAMVKLLRSHTLRDVVFLTPPDCSDTFRSFFESVLKSRGYSDQPRSGMECGLDVCHDWRGDVPGSPSNGFVISREAAARDSRCGWDDSRTGGGDWSNRGGNGGNGGLLGGGNGGEGMYGSGSMHGMGAGRGGGAGGGGGNGSARAASMYAGLAGLEGLGGLTGSTYAGMLATGSEHGGGGGGAGGNKAQNAAAMRAMQAAKLRASKTALERHDVEIIGSGPELLIFSHGFGFNKNVWSGVIKALDKTRYKIVLYNVTGALGTDYDAFDYQRYSTLHGFTDDLLLLLHELGVEGRERGQQCTVVGQQQAGMVALLASLERPTLFKRIVLLSSSPRLLGAEGYEGSYALEDLDQVFGIMQGNFKVRAVPL